MNKAKLIFNQTLMISTAILLGMGIRAAVLFLMTGEPRVDWQWYLPLSIILVGFLCALASLLLYDDSVMSSVKMRLRICLHFLLVFGIVSLSGFLFNWYSSPAQYLLIVVMYVLIYAFVWIATIWELRADADKINNAISEIRDEE